MLIVILLMTVVVTMVIARTRIVEYRMKVGHREDEIKWLRTTNSDLVMKLARQRLFGNSNVAEALQEYNGHQIMTRLSRSGDSEYANCRYKVEVDVITMSGASFSRDVYADNIESAVAALEGTAKDFIDRSLAFDKNLKTCSDAVDRALN